ncbi:MAG TPA: response regulator transcription factor [Candidatus Acidoferrum sp.]|nr:response regulator transcription factor [Candidatus Acidoferrum sp.]
MKQFRITVLLVDDFVQFRAAVSALLTKKPELQIVAEASDGIEAVEKSRQLQPDVILLDIGLPKLNGIEAARQIREVAPQSKIVFVTQETSADIMKEAIGLGGMGYVVKAKVESELLKAIDLVREGKQFIGSGLTGNP